MVVTNIASSKGSRGKRRNRKRGEISGKDVKISGKDEDIIEERGKKKDEDIITNTNTGAVARKERGKKKEKIEKLISPNREELVLIRAIDLQEFDVGRGGRCDLFKLDMATGVIDKVPGEPLWGDDSSGGMAVSGSSVYIIGGLPPPLEETKSKSRGFRFDLDKPGDGWSKLPPFKCPIIFLRPAVAYKGMVYVFGAAVKIRLVEEHPAGARWLVIPPPKELATATGEFRKVNLPPILDLANKRIILHIPDMDSLYAYYPDKIDGDCWQLVADNFPEYRWGECVILMDGLLIFYRGKGRTPFVVYDLQNKKFMDVIFPPAGFGAVLDGFLYEAFFPLYPRVMCLAAYAKDSDNWDITHLVFLKFFVKRASRDEVLIKHVCRQDLFLYGGYNVCDFVAL